MTHPYIESAVQHDIKINQGALYKWTFTWKDSDDVIVPITGATVRMSLRTEYSAAAATVAWTSPTNITLSATAPSVTVSVIATATAAIAAGDYVYDLEIDFGAGDVVRLFEGTAVVTPQVTY